MEQQRKEVARGTFHGKVVPAVLDWPHIAQKGPLCADNLDLASTSEVLHTNRGDISGSTNRDVA